MVIYFFIFLRIIKLKIRGGESKVPKFFYGVVIKAWVYINIRFNLCPRPLFVSICATISTIFLFLNLMCFSVIKVIIILYNKIIVIKDTIFLFKLTILLKFKLLFVFQQEDLIN